MKNRIFIFLLMLPCFSLLAQGRTELLQAMTDSCRLDRYPGIHSILIARGDSIVYEQYFNGFNRDSLHDMRSSFKAVTALLTGIAIDRRLIRSTSEPVFNWFPAGDSLIKKDSRRRAMTIQDLLNMQSGLDCEEFNGTHDCEDAMTQTANWLDYALQIPLKNMPGHIWSYTSCDPVILGGIVSKAAGYPVTELARQFLFEPMGIKKYRWTIDPAGNAMTAGSFYLRPVDMLKLGQLVNQRGKWHGKHLISSSWIHKVSNPEIAIPGFSFARSSRSQLLIPQQTFYGNYWYRELLKTENFSEELLFASGNGGQYIILVRRLNLVVVFTQGNYNTWRAKQAFDILARYIIPALKGG